MKSQIIQSAKIIILALVIGVGASYISAQTPPPCSNPSGCNVASPINESANAQTKSGSFGVASNSGANFVSFGNSYLLKDTFVGAESLPISGGEVSSFPANLGIFGNLNSTGHGAFGDYAGSNYLEVGHDGAHSYIDAKNSGEGTGFGLLLNYYSGGDVIVGGGSAGASNLNVSGNVKVGTLSSSATQTVCADTVGKLVPCVVVPPTTTTTTYHTQIYSRSGGSQVTSGSLGASNPSSFTVPANVTEINIKIWAAGGGGGGKSNWHEGGGGGGGGFAQGTLTVTPLTSYNITVGAGGIAGSNVNNSQTDGLQGGNSLFGSNITVVGGGGGKAAPAGAGTQAWGGLGGLGGGVNASGVEKGKGSDGEIGGSNCTLAFPASSCGKIPSGGNSGFPIIANFYGKGGNGGYLSTNSSNGSDGYIEISWEETI